MKRLLLTNIWVDMYYNVEKVSFRGMRFSALAIPQH